jgi:single-strand DNA-binding protein
VTVWGEQAELCSKYLAKGRSVYIEGRLQSRQWTDKDGGKRSSSDIVADRVVFLGGGGAGAANGSERRPPGQHDEGSDTREPHNPGAPPRGEDIPF